MTDCTTVDNLAQGFTILLLIGSGIGFALGFMAGRLHEIGKTTPDPADEEGAK